MRTILRLARACRLLAANVRLLGAIVLAVWLPGNLLIETLIPAADLARRLQAEAWIELLFGPIASAALVQALAALERTEPVGAVAALRAGFGAAGRLLKVRLASAALILLGLVALVVPGVLLMVRWAVVDAVVVLEGAGIRAALARSAVLTRGMRWSILLTGVLCLLGGIGLTEAFDALTAGVPALDHVVTRVALACAGDVAGSVLDVVLFLFYWEAHGRERAPAAPLRGVV